MTCTSCQARQTNLASGLYSLACEECCAALVLSAYPSKRLATTMLAAIERFKGNPGRARVLACVAQKLERHRLVLQRSASDT